MVVNINIQINVYITQIFLSSQSENQENNSQHKLTKSKGQIRTECHFEGKLIVFISFIREEGYLISPNKNELKDNCKK